MALVQTALTICNRALFHLAINKPITNLNDTTRPEAVACALFYEQTLAEVLREFPWPFAWRYAPLVLVDGTEAIATAQDFQYAYRIPDDAVRVNRILSDLTVVGVTDVDRIPFSLGSDGVGGLVYTDIPPEDATSTTLQQPQLEYIGLADVARFPGDFAQVVSLKLAHYLAPSLTKGDDFKLGARAYDLYQQMRLEAKGAAVREQQIGPPGDSEFIRARL